MSKDAHYNSWTQHENQGVNLMRNFFNFSHHNFSCLISMLSLWRSFSSLWHIKQVQGDKDACSQSAFDLKWNGIWPFWALFRHSRHLQTIQVTNVRWYNFIYVIGGLSFTLISHSVSFLGAKKWIPIILPSSLQSVMYHHYSSLLFWWCLDGNHELTSKQ